MHFEFKVEVEVNGRRQVRQPREELSTTILEAIDESNPSEIETELGGLYEVTGWEVSEVE